MRTLLQLALALLCAVTVLSSCESMHPVLDMGAALGVASGTITNDQANSITRTAKAVGKTFEDITPEQEYYIGRAVAATVLSRYRPYNKEELNLYVNDVGQSLAEASDRPETFGGYHFLVVDSPEVNAFAAPGGLILVTRGMLRCCKSEDALAAVLAHEIGHVQDRDGLRAIQTGRITTALTVLAAEGAKNLAGPQVAQLTEAFEGSVTDVATTLMNSGYSRQLERQADEVAIVILRRVGYNPSALVDMLKTMKTQLKPGGMDFAKTHPDPEDRIKEIQSLASSPTKIPPPAARQARFERAMAMI
jgi:beta-barrel assembly-enhancing protease